MEPEKKISYELAAPIVANSAEQDCHEMIMSVRSLVN